MWRFRHFIGQRSSPRKRLQEKLARFPKPPRLANQQYTVLYPLDQKSQE